MKDSNDNLTIELFPSAGRGRGRPKSPNSLSNADRQRLHREKMRQSPPVMVTLSDFEEFLRRERAGMSELASSGSEYSDKARAVLDYFSILELRFKAYLKNGVSKP